MISCAVHGADMIGSDPRHPYAAGDSIYFSADDMVHGPELWHCAPSGHCALAADLLPGEEGAEPWDFIALGPYLYFQTNSPVYGRHLCFLNAETAAVVNLTRPIAALADTKILYVHGADDGVIFVAASPEGVMEVWATHVGSDACAKIDTLQASLASYIPVPWMLYSLGARLLCLDLGTLLLFEDLESPGVRIPIPAPLSVRRIMDGQLGDNTLALIVAHPDYGPELFRLDIASGAIALIRNILPGPAGSDVTQEMLHGEWLYFVAEDDRHGRELWRSDGTAEGTQLVKDIAPGIVSSNPYNLCSVGELLFFVADDGVHGKELWRTNAVTGETRMVSDLTPGVAGTELWALTAFQGRLYFCAETPIYGEEVYVTDGVSDSVQVLRDIVPGPGSSGPHNLRVFGDKLFFTCNDGLHGEEPWISDGTEQGTHLAADIAFALPTASSNPEQLTALNDMLIFAANDGIHGLEPWVSDGMESGARLLRDISPGATGSRPAEMTRHLDSVFFCADSPQYGQELWRTEGAYDSTRLVFDIAAGEAGAAPRLLRSLGRCLYFTADDGMHGRGLWRLCNDQPPEMLSDSATAGNILDIFCLWDTVYLYVRQENGDTALVRLVEDNEGLSMTPAAYKADMDIETFIAACPDTMDAQACKDGLARLIHPPEVAHPSVAIMADGTFFFTAHTPSFGAELWKSNGAVSGTGLVRDIFPGPASAGPDQFAIFRERLYFIAETPADGRVLFVSDGTEESTAPLSANHYDFTWPPLPTECIAPLDNGLLLMCVLPARAGKRGPYLAAITHDGSTHGCAPVHELPAAHQLWPRHITSVGAYAFFTQQDEAHGVELWVTDATADGTRMLKDINTGP